MNESSGSGSSSNNSVSVSVVGSDSLENFSSLVAVGVGVSTTSTNTPTQEERRGGGTGGGGDDDDHNSNRWPPGFRFHPTDEELVLYYLKRKICRGRLKLNIIGDVDVNKCEPWELPGKSLLQTGDKQWYFFSPRDRKYPNGARTNRGTKCGYWKTTGKDRHISRNARTVGTKKTLVFYKGRAPKGERTDWVMHEYTIAKQELNNSHTVWDSYALYKVYQKSGPGPKNGEQYGAPFREEEWLDDDPFHDRLGNPTNADNLFPLPELTADGFCRGLSPDNVEEVSRKMADDSHVNQQHVNSLSHASEVDGQSSWAGSLLGEAISGAATGIHEIWQQNEQVDEQAIFQIAKSVGSLLRPPEASEVTSFPHGFEHEPRVTDGDFMELIDLMDPEPVVSTLGSISKHNPFLDKDGFYDFDFYFDAPMYLPEEIVPTEGTGLQPYLDSFSADVAGQLDYHLPASFDDENQYLAANVTTQLWTHEQQRFSVFSPAESSQVVLAPSASGVVHRGNSMNMINEGTQNQGSYTGDSSERWFTSAINSLLESVPTNPASASENALISRALERMSSFGAVRIGPRARDVAADTGAFTRREGRNGSVLFLSFLGALWAILWVLMIGTVVKIFKAFFGRFVAS